MYGLFWRFLSSLRYRGLLTEDIAAKFSFMPFSKALQLSSYTCYKGFTSFDPGHFAGFVTYRE